MNPLTEYFHLQLEESLRKRRVVVWYDAEREFAPFLATLEQTEADLGLPKVKLGSTQARLARYDGSFFALRLEIEPLVETARPDPLLIYVPGEKPDEQGSPLKELECAGELYQRSLSKVSKQLLKRIFTEGVIDEMFRDKQLGYGDILTLLEPSGDTGGSVLKLVLGEGDGGTLLARWIAEPQLDDTIEAKGGRSELTKLIATRSGLDLKETADLAQCRDQFARFLLLNEFRQGLQCEPPATLSLIPSVGLKEQRDFNGRILDRLRTHYAETFERIADSVEQEFGLSNAAVPAEQLGSIDTFRFEERVMLAYIGEQIAAGQYDTAAKLAVSHRESFWARRDLSRRPAQWDVCALLAELGVQIARVLTELRTLNGTKLSSQVLVARYAAEDGWHRLDLLHRMLETRVAQMQDEPEAEKALAVVRSKVEDALRDLAAVFAHALEKDHWTVPGALHQTKIYPQKIASLPGKVAWFLVDALRFEMGTELARQLPEAVELELTPAVAALPSITPLCMAALLPGASSSYAVVEHEGKAAARIGNAVLADVTERMKFLKAEVPDSTDITLEQLLQRSPSKVKEKIGDARLLVVRSPEIDSLGEKHEFLARQLMETVIGNLTRAVRKLASMGYERFVITADHGHQFASRKEDDMKVEAPGGDTVELHRRCWIGKGPSIPVGSIRITATDLGYDSPLDFVFPQGLSVFKAGGGLSYHHGGFSLQELLIPVVCFRMPIAPSKKKSSGPSVRLSVEPALITNRTFVVNVELESDLVLRDSVRVRVVLVSKGEEVGYEGMANGAMFDRDAKVLTLEPGQSANVVLLLTRADIETVQILVQDEASAAVYAESKILPVKVKS